MLASVPGAAASVTLHRTGGAHRVSLTMGTVGHYLFVDAIAESFVLFLRAVLAVPRVRLRHGSSVLWAAPTYVGRSGGIVGTSLSMTTAAYMFSADVSTVWLFFPGGDVLCVSLRRFRYATALRTQCGGWLHACCQRCDFLFNLVVLSDEPLLMPGLLFTMGSQGFVRPSHPKTHLSLATVLRLGGNFVIFGATIPSS